MARLICTLLPADQSSRVLGTAGLQPLVGLPYTLWKLLAGKFPLLAPEREISWQGITET
jgi:hypothetical protein